mmetsp:Transcript_12341/g.33960  ORF Transcript_12341/g.33960 Transcript_12341/m.33960 type:complete len:206 (+) Transcript_12341:390-1007(+)
MSRRRLAFTCQPLWRHASSRSKRCGEHVALTCVAFLNLKWWSTPEENHRQQSTEEKQRNNWRGAFRKHGVSCVEEIWFGRAGWHAVHSHGIAIGMFLVYVIFGLAPPCTTRQSGHFYVLLRKSEDVFQDIHFPVKLQRRVRSRRCGHLDHHVHVHRHLCHGHASEVGKIQIGFSSHVSCSLLYRPWIGVLEQLCGHAHREQNSKT